MTKQEAITKILAAGKKDDLTEAQVKALEEHAPEASLAYLATLAAKSPADALIQAQHNANIAIAAHGHALNTADEAAKTAAAKAAADKAAKAKEDAADGGADDAEENAKGEKMKAAAAKEGISVEEYEEREFLKRAPASIRTMAEKHKAAEAARKTDLIKALDGGLLTVKQLEAKTVDELETLAAYAGVAEEKVDYSGRGVARAAESDVYANPPNPYSQENINKRFKTAVN